MTTTTGHIRLETVCFMCGDSAVVQIVRSRPGHMHLIFACGKHGLEADVAALL